MLWRSRNCEDGGWCIWWLCGSAEGGRGAGLIVIFFFFFIERFEGWEGVAYGCGSGGEEEGGVLEPGLRGGKVWHFMLSSR